ncbi:MAG: hypothetical protein HZB38_04590, partial [Planctomycetes bacterium]|nr:hypothetical protein [Planctomycetota bacterium]
YEDWDFWIALLAAGWRGVRIPRPLFWYRKHSGGSMLDKTHPHREAMRRRIIEHHPGLFAAAWPESASETRVETGEIYQRLLTEAELSHIENSRLWRTVQRVRRWAAYRILQKLSVLPASRPEGTDAADRLQRIKSSLEYRMIQRLKRSWIYRRYADRKYGPDMRRLPQ